MCNHAFGSFTLMVKAIDIVFCVWVFFSSNILFIFYIMFVCAYVSFSTHLFCSLSLHFPMKCVRRKNTAAIPYLDCLFFDVAYTCNDDENDNDDKTLPSFDMYVCVCCVCGPMILLCKWLNWFFFRVFPTRFAYYTFWLNGILFSYLNQTTTGSMILSLILKYIQQMKFVCICIGNEPAFVQVFFFFLFLFWFFAFHFPCLHLFCKEWVKTCV